MALLYLVAGAAHCLQPELFLPIMPEWIPYPRPIVIGTGYCEIAGAIGLMTSRFRAAAGVMLALYALGVWPANIKHAVYHVILPPIPDSWWYHGPRILFQPLLVWGALYCSGVVNWPWSLKGGRNYPQQVRKRRLFNPLRWK